MLWQYSCVFPLAPDESHCHDLITATAHQACQGDFLHSENSRDQCACRCMGVGGPSCVGVDTSAAIKFQQTVQDSLECPILTRHGGGGESVSHV